MTLSAALQPVPTPGRSAFLFVTPTYLPFVGGAAAFAQAMAKRLAADGHSVTVLTTSAMRQTDFWAPPGAARLRSPAREVTDGVRVERLDLAYPRPAPYAFGLRRRAGYWLNRTRLPAPVQVPALRWLARQMPPLPGMRAALQQMAPNADLIHVFDSSWDGLFTEAVNAAGRLGKPCVVAPLMHLGGASVQRSYLMDHQVAAYRSAGAVLALSSSEARAYAGLGVPPDRVRGIAMGIDPDAWTQSTPGAVEAFRRSRGLTRSTVAFLGANTYDKGAFTLALAVAELAQAGVAVDAIYAGPLSELLETFVRRQSPSVRNALEGKLHILGTVDEETKHAMLEACDLLALPSRVDSFGIVMLEAWQHGKPVIGATAGGIPDVIQSEENGLLVPFGDVPALAAAIRRLVTEPHLAENLGDTGRRRVLGYYNWHYTYRALMGIYRAFLPVVE
jgi:glycogen synthase